MNFRTVYRSDLVLRQSAKERLICGVSGLAQENEGGNMPDFIPGTDLTIRPVIGTHQEMT